VPGLKDLDAYLARIGLSGRPGLAEVHRAHATSIPFENLDSCNGAPVSLDPGRLEDKLVARRRGGYCFEQNLLLAMALESLGIGPVTPMLARVLVGGDGSPRPRTHLVLQVLDGATAWHADVGFGAGGPLDPIPFGPGDEQDQEGWRYRVIEAGDELILQSYGDGAWEDQYSFEPRPVPFVDIETSNWFVSTWPDSPFVASAILGAHRVGTQLMLRVAEAAVLTERTPTRSTESPVTLDEVPRVLAERFGLAGTRIGPRGLPTAGEDR